MRHARVFMIPLVVLIAGCNTVVPSPSLTATAPASPATAANQPWQDADVAMPSAVASAPSLEPGSCLSG